MSNKRVLIIGGGIAGLSAGIYARLNGFEATILEMHDKPGGQLTAWDRDGYRFDYCLHWLVGTGHGVFNDIWKETHAITDDVEVVNHRTFARIQDEREGEFVIYNNLDEWEAYLVEMAPEDEEAIAEMCRMMRKSVNMEQFEDAPELRSVGDYIAQAWQIGSFFPTLVKYGKKTMQELFTDLGFKNKRLLYFMNQLFTGGDFSALGFMMTMGWAHDKNAGYLKGGSLNMALRMAQRFRTLGGEFRFQAKVSEIIVEDHVATGVRLSTGEEMHADHVISACDGHTTLYHLLDAKYVTDEIATAYDEWPLFTPLVMIGFGIDDVITSEYHNSTYMPKTPMDIGRTSVDAYSIMNRSMYDPSFAPEGKTALLIQFESPWEVWEPLKGVAYHEEKEEIRKTAISLLEKHYPGIKEKIEVIDIATPQTTVRYTGVWKAAYEGFRPTTDVLNGLPMRLDALENFTMIGQWLFPGGGLPPSAQSGKWAIQMLLNDEKEEARVFTPNLR